MVVLLLLILYLFIGVFKNNICFIILQSLCFIRIIKIVRISQIRIVGFVSFLACVVQFTLRFFDVLLLYVTACLIGLQFFQKHVAGNHLRNLMCKTPLKPKCTPQGSMQLCFKLKDFPQKLYKA